MPGQLSTILQDLARFKGFVAGNEAYATVPEMVASMRELEDLPFGSALTDVQRRALLENLRRVILRTAHGPSAVESVRIQSTLRRWHFLRAASPEAANAYIEVLRYFQIVVPECLFEGAAND